MPTGDLMRRVMNLLLLAFHEALPTTTETAFGSHPCRVVSVTYVRTHCFHGDDTIFFLKSKRVEDCGNSLSMCIADA